MDVTSTYIKKTLSLSNQSTFLLHHFLLKKYFSPVSHACWKAEGIRVNQHRSLLSCQEEAKEECRVENSVFHKFWERSAEYILEGQEAALAGHIVLAALAVRWGTHCPSPPLSLPPGFSYLLFKIPDCHLNVLVVQVHVASFYFAWHSADSFVLGKPLSCSCFKGVDFPFIFSLWGQAARLLFWGNRPCPWGAMLRSITPCSVKPHLVKATLPELEKIFFLCQKHFKSTQCLFTVCFILQICLSMSDVVVTLHWLASQPLWVTQIFLQKSLLGKTLPGGPQQQASSSRTPLACPVLMKERYISFSLFSK